jgi:hypothetical protein
MSVVLHTKTLNFDVIDISYKIIKSINNKVLVKKFFIINTQIYYEMGKNKIE